MRVNGFFVLHAERVGGEENDITEAGRTAGILSDGELLVVRVSILSDQRVVTPTGSSMADIWATIALQSC